MQMGKGGMLLLNILVAATVLHNCVAWKECYDCGYSKMWEYLASFSSFRLQATSDSKPQQFCLTFEIDGSPKTEIVGEYRHLHSAAYKVKYATEDNTIRDDYAKVTVLLGEIRVHFNSSNGGEPLQIKLPFVYTPQCFVAEQISQGKSYYHVFVSATVTDGAYRECVGKLQEYSGGTVNYLNKDRDCDQVMKLTDFDPPQYWI